MTGRKFVPELESARGIAACLVAALHVSQAPTLVHGMLVPLIESVDTTSPVSFFLGRLYSALAAGHRDIITPSVLFFFVLSGFVLTRSFGTRAVTPATIGRFVKDRLFRIYPAVIFCVLVFACLYWSTGLRLSGPEMYTTVELLKTAALLQTGVNGVLWTLQSEMLAVPFLLLLFFSNQRFGLKGPLVLTTVFTLLLFVSAWREMMEWPQRHVWLYAFGFGAITALMRVQLSQKAAKVIAVAALALLVIVPAFMVGSRIFRMIVEALAAAGLVLSLSRGFEGRITMVLRAPLLRFLGRISFSLYLLHPLTLMVLWNMQEALGALVTDGVPPALLALGLLALSLAATIPLAWLSYVWVEQPALAIGRRLGGTVPRAVEPACPATPEAGQKMPG